MSNSSRIRTDELLALLFKARNLEQFLKRSESAYLTLSFGAYLRAWCAKFEKVPEQIIRRANLEKSYGHQLFRDKRNPSRDTVLQLAFAMEADLSQTQEMLKVARRSPLYPRVKRDAVLIYCLHNRISLVDTQIILQDLGLPLLGGRDK